MKLFELIQFRNLLQKFPGQLFKSFPIRKICELQFKKFVKIEM